MAMMTPFLMFEGAAKQAMEFYVSLFDDGQVLSVTPREDPSREYSSPCSAWPVSR
jgi:predicted 3-demethylubiquinone-9 3-methyltransferase (glyoxalase superfamily)